LKGVRVVDAWDVVASEMNEKIACLKKDLSENNGRGQGKKRVMLRRLEKWMAVMGSGRGYRKKELPARLFISRRSSGL
jgi:hypothetical protein